METFESQITHYYYLFRGMGFGYKEVVTLGDDLRRLLRPIPYSSTGGSKRIDIRSIIQKAATHRDLMAYSELMRFKDMPNDKLNRGALQEMCKRVKEEGYFI